MAKARKSTKASNNWKRKTWYDVVAPKSFGEKEIGHVVSMDPEGLKDRTISVNLMTLSGNVRKQHVEIRLLIDKVNGTKVNTTLKRYKMNTAYVKRMARRGKTKISDSVILASKDGVLFKFKPIIITRSLINSGVRSALKLEFLKFAAFYVSQKNFDEVLSDIISSKMQKFLKIRSDIIYPSSIIDISTLEVVQSGKPITLTEDQMKTLKKMAEETEVKMQAAAQKRAARFARK